MTAPVLHFEDRPYTSPCALCPADIPLDQTVSLADPDRNTVCDDCAKEIDPQQHTALEVLRVVDEIWWELAAPAGRDAAGAAAEYLRHVAAGVAVLAEFYGATSSTTSPNVSSAGEPHRLTPESVTPDLH